MKKDIYKKIVVDFVSLFDKETWPCSAVLDGSVNNHEHIYGFSDIDIKIFADPKMINKKFLQYVSSVINKSLGENKIVFNAWVLSTNDFPDKEIGVYFDFVRRYVLKQGQLFFGDIDLANIKLKFNINSMDKNLCISNIVSFLIRLRRIITNPKAISDVKDDDVYFILQQGIAYYFHFLRYFNAFFGCVILKIEDNVVMYKKNSFIDKKQIDFSKDVLEMRNNWNNILNIYTKENAIDFLVEVVQEMEFSLDNFLRPNIASVGRLVIYK